MVKSEYDSKREVYIITISKQELEEAYRDFLLKNFGFHLTEYDQVEGI